MGKETLIEWCDSTGNLQMGCDGCELWNPKAGVEACYAGAQTKIYAGLKGWPDSFDQPKLFLNRLDAMLKWSDLRGKTRDNKPWLDGYPRIIFLDDMGDTFTESLPLMWLEPVIEQMANSKHIWQFLTKRPKRMAEFFRNIGHVPKNFWLMTTVTSKATLPRIADLLSIEGASVYGVSYEPMWGSIAPAIESFLMDIKFDDGSSSPRVNWFIAGGESGPAAKPFHPKWAGEVELLCAEHDVPFFWKQNGEWIPSTWLNNELCDDDAFWAYWNTSQRFTFPDGVECLRIGKKEAGRWMGGCAVHNGMPHNTWNRPMPQPELF